MRSFKVFWKRVITKTTSNQVYIIGGTNTEFDQIKRGLIQEVEASMQLDIAQLAPSLEKISFFGHINYAIICTPDGIQQLSPRAIAFLKQVAEQTSSRIYLTADVPEEAFKPFESFIQKVNYSKGNTLYRLILDFFENIDNAARIEHLLAIRDNVCLALYYVLKPIWSISYFVAILFAIHTGYTYFFNDSPPWNNILQNQLLVGTATVLWFFFCAHAVISILVNSIFFIPKLKEKKLDYQTLILFLLLSLVFVSDTVIKINTSNTWIFAGLAILIYQIFISSRSVRAECTSLSQISAMNPVPTQHNELVYTIGVSPYPTSAFPFRASRAGSIFVSYMHKSEKWSAKYAHQLYRDFKELNGRLISGNGKQQSTKYEVFLDQSTLPPAGLWRRHLLRAISECNYFVALLDDDFLDSSFVYAESIYASLLRKNVAKPRILLVFKSKESMARIKDSGYGLLYKDVFEQPENSVLGSGILIDEAPSLSSTIAALEKIKPMQLLPLDPHLF